MSPSVQRRPGYSRPPAPIPHPLGAFLTCAPPHPLVSVLVLDRGEPGDTRRLLAGVARAGRGLPASTEVLVGHRGRRAARDRRCPRRWRCRRPEPSGRVEPRWPPWHAASCWRSWRPTPDPTPAGWRPRRTSLRRDVTVGCVASKVLDWDGERTLFAGAALGWTVGCYPAASTARPTGATARATACSPTLAGLVVRRVAHERIGGFDEHFDACGAGRRLRVAALAGRLEGPLRALARSCTGREHGPWDQLSLAERDELEAVAGLFSAFTCWGDDLQARARRRRRDGLPGAGEAAGGRARLRCSRSASSVQAGRVRPDSELLRFFRVPDGEAGGRRPGPRLRRGPLRASPGPGAHRRRAGRAHGRARHPRPTRSPGRWPRSTTCGSCRWRPTSSTTRPSGSGRSTATGSCESSLRWCDVAVVQGNLPRQLPVLAASDKVLVVDLYDPIHLEQLAQLQGRDPEVQEDTLAGVDRRCSTPSCAGATSSCAPAPSSATSGSARLSVVGRLNPRTYAGDPMFERLIAVAPVRRERGAAGADRTRASAASCPASAPTTRCCCGAAASTTGSTRSRSSGPSTLVKDKVPGVRLVFLGTAHPNPKVGDDARWWREARALADELGLTGPTCSSTTPGCPTTSARTSCSTPTSA